MDELVGFLKKIAPEMEELIEKRYSILKNIYFNQPIGRRLLAVHMDMGERIVRKELDFLKDQNLIRVTPAGMVLEQEGVELIKGLQDFVRVIKGFHQLEERVKDLLNIERVYIVHGNVDKDLSVKKDMGRLAAYIIRQYIEEGSIIAVSGGSSLAEVAEQMPVQHVKSSIEVIPARGGLGEVVEYQANSIAAKLAGKLGGSYKLLYVPDNISKEALEKIILEPSVKEVINKIKQAHILVFGIGTAEDMAKRRKLPQHLVYMLKDKNATAEALGFYFDISGRIVYTSTSVGLSLEDYSNIPWVVAVAGGTRKARAIMAAASLFGSKTILVTDEGAAGEIIRLKHQ